jgi:hypothetical protein
MALPASGAISLSAVNTELGLSATATISLNDSGVRTLFGVASGSINMANGYGKSNAPPGSPVWATQTAITTAAPNSGGAGTRNAALVFGGGSTASPLLATQSFNGSSWSTGGNLPAASCNNQGIGTQTDALSIGGYNGGYQTSCYAYNGTAWSTPSSTATPASNRGVAGTTSATLTWGGAIISSPYATYAAEKRTGTTWSGTGGLLAVRAICAGAGTQTAALAAGGQAPLVGHLTSCETFNGTSWASGTALPVIRSAHTAFGTQSNLIIAGGNNNSVAASAGVNSWNGTAWSTLSNSNYTSLTAAYCGGTTAGFIVSGSNHESFTR